MPSRQESDELLGIIAPGEEVAVVVGVVAEV